MRGEEELRRHGEKSAQKVRLEDKGLEKEIHDDHHAGHIPRGRGGGHSLRAGHVREHIPQRPGGTLRQGQDGHGLLLKLYNPDLRRVLRQRLPVYRQLRRHKQAGAPVHKYLRADSAELPLHDRRKYAGDHGHTQRPGCGEDLLLGGLLRHHGGAPYERGGPNDILKRRDHRHNALCHEP